MFSTGEPLVSDELKFRNGAQVSFVVCKAQVLQIELNEYQQPYFRDGSGLARLDSLTLCSEVRRQVQRYGSTWSYTPMLAAKTLTLVTEHTFGLHLLVAKRQAALLSKANECREEVASNC